MQNKNQLEVEVIKNDHGWKLIPRYDHDADILEVRNPNIKDWPFGVDIDGNIIFDLDKDKLLANFDLHIPMTLWEEVDILQKPNVKDSGVLKFTESTIKNKSFNIPIKTYKSKNSNELLLEFGDNVEKGYGVKLSDFCIAILDRNRLIGFFIRMK